MIPCFVNKKLIIFWRISLKRDFLLIKTQELEGFQGGTWLWFSQLYNKSTEYSDPEVLNEMIFFKKNTLISTRSFSYVRLQGHSVNVVLATIFLFLLKMLQHGSCRSWWPFG